MRNYLFVFMLATLPAISCKKNSGSPAPPPPSAGKDVYVAGIDYSGSHYNGRSWKNGTVMSLTDGTKESYASAIAVSGNDIYVTGYENNDTVNVAKYWKNGVAHILPVPQSQGNGSYPRNAYANGVAFSGTDMYTAGGVVYETTNGEYAAWIWKNGETLPFTFGADPFNDIKHSFNSIAAAGTDVYTAGTELGHNSNHFVAKYWKKSEGILLAVGVPLTDGSVSAEAFAITVSGNDVYEAGYEQNGKNQAGVAKYWKNGVAVALTDGSKDAEANAIVVIGSDVYVAGYENNGNADVAKYWKNGVAVALTDGRLGDAAANAIAVSGSDVYVVGVEGPGASYAGRYWKNGVSTTFNGGKPAEPLSIALGN